MPEWLPLSGNFSLFRFPCFLYLVPAENNMVSFIVFCEDFQARGEIITVPACDDIIGSCPRKQKSLQDDKETSPTYDVTEKTVIKIKKGRGGKR